MFRLITAIALLITSIACAIMGRYVEAILFFIASSLESGIEEILDELKEINAKHNP